MYLFSQLCPIWSKLLPLCFSHTVTLWLIISSGVAITSIIFLLVALTVLWVRWSTSWSAFTIIILRYWPTILISVGRAGLAMLPTELWAELTEIFLCWIVVKANICMPLFWNPWRKKCDCSITWSIFLLDLLKSVKKEVWL